MPISAIGNLLTRGGPLRWPSFFLGPILLALAAYAPPLGAYSGVAEVTLSWGVGGTAASWSSSGQNALAVLSNASRFTAAAGSNQTAYFNPDFAAGSNYDAGPGDDCLTALPGYDSIVLRKYGCRQLDSTGTNVPVFHPSPALDAGPAAAAVGTLNFTDTTLTGTLTVVATTDEPTGGDESSSGSGASAFNVRALDGSAYGNAWYGVSTGATLTVDLTGNFSAAGWEITGGTVRLTDPGFQCQQGGIGGVAPDFVLCQLSAVPGGLDGTGSNLSFGLDADGGGAGTAMTEVLVRDDTGTVVASLGGVLASLTVTAGGVLATDFGEYRAGAGTGTGGCGGQIRWDGSKITCGTLTAGALEITGTATPVDTDPDPFAFGSVTDVELNSAVTSGAVTITGIAAPARITVAGGQYSVGCTDTFTSAAGNISDGATVCVGHTSAATPETDTVTTLTVGTVSGTFTSTTLAGDIIGLPFQFTDQLDVPVSTAIVSGAVTITGINVPVDVSVAGGEYSIGCNGLFTAVTGPISNGQTVCVRHTSAAAPLTATNTVLTVAGNSDTFTSTTEPADTVGLPFSFTDQVNVTESTVIVSNTVTITGINGPAPISIAGGEYSIGCSGAFTAVPGTMTNGQTVCVRHTSAATALTATNTVLTVAGNSDTFTSTTVPPDVVGQLFTFTDQTNVQLSTLVVSDSVTIAGINVPLSISVTGGEYSIGCSGVFTAAPGTISNGQTVCVRHTSASTPLTQTSTLLSVGSQSDTFTTTTVAPPPDTTPDAFSFANQADVPLAATITSAPVTISGIDAPAPVTVTGGQYAIGCAGAFTSAAGTITDGETVCVRHTSAAGNSTVTSTTLTVGGVSDSFASTTVAADGGGGGGGGAVDWWLLAFLASLPAVQRRRAYVPGR